MRKIFITAIFLFCMSFTLNAETLTSNLLNNSKEIVQIPAIYMQTTKDGKTETQSVAFTEQTEQVLLKSLEGLISVFEKTNKNLKDKKSTFRVSEVEINASLEGKMGFKIVEGSSQASMKIILRPEN